MVTTDDLALAHTAFLGWLNGQLDAPTAAPPFAELVTEIKQQLVAGEAAKVVLLEVYLADHLTLAGFVVVSALGVENQRLTYFTATGVPQSYNVGGSGSCLDATPEGLIAGFSENGVAVLYQPNNDVWGAVGLFTELHWGTRFPFLTVENAGVVVGKSLLDVYYPERGAGSYGVVIRPTTVANSYTVKNVSGQVLDLAIPLFGNYTLRRRLAPTETLLVAITPTSTYRLEKLRKQGLLTYLSNAPAI